MMGMRMRMRMGLGMGLGMRLRMSLYICLDSQTQDFLNRRKMCWAGWQRDWGLWGRRKRRKR